MNPARIVIILVAGVAAIVLALFVRNMVAKPKAPPAVVVAQAPAPITTRVLVAKTDLAVGTALSRENMSWQDWPLTTLNAAYITDGAQAVAAKTGAAGAIDTATKAVTDAANNGGPKMLAMVGAIVREPIYAGEPITSKKTVRSGDSSYMAVRLPAGFRAMTLPLTAESGIGGFVQPGDRVDVMSVHADTTRTGGAAQVTDMVLPNALVLAVDQRTDPPKAGAAAVGASITLEVPVGSMPTVARAVSQNGLSMALRSYADAGGRTAVSTADTHTVRLFKGGAAAEVVATQ